MISAGWPRFGSVWLQFGVGTVLAVPLRRSFSCVSVEFNRERRFRFRFRFPKNGSGGSGSSSGSWKTVPAVPVSGSGSVPEPPCS